MVIFGDLRHVIQVIGKTITKDEYGAETTVWTNKIRLKAGVKYAGGDRTIDNKEIFNSQRIIFTTLFRKTITENDRIEFRGKKYFIKSIVEIGFKEGLQIDTELIND
jgi:SPP1 family predicted phage head-tail adaptor